jgi:hypothetical protein
MKGEKCQHERKTTTASRSVTKIRYDHSGNASSAGEIHRRGGAAFLRRKVASTLVYSGDSSRA